MDAEYIVRIRNVATGEVRVKLWESPWQGPFWWAEGNGACDCNRGQFFLESEYDFDTMDDDEDNALCPCGHERYKLTIVSSDEKTLLWTDDVHPALPSMGAGE